MPSSGISCISESSTKKLGCFRMLKYTCFFPSLTINAVFSNLQYDFMKNAVPELQGHEGHLVIVALGAGPFDHGTLRVSILITQGSFIK